MGMKNYKPVFDGVTFKTPMQRMLEEQVIKLKEEADAIRAKSLVKTEGEVEDGRTKSNTRTK
jgi:hypothetical protein